MTSSKRPPNTLAFSSPASFPPRPARLTSILLSTTLLVIALSSFPE